MSRYVKIGAETTFGAGATSTVGIHANNVSDPIDRGVLRDNSISSSVPVAVVGGALNPSGTLKGALRPIQMMPLFKALFGDSDTNGTTTTYSLGLPKSIEIEVGEKTSTTTSMETSYTGVGIKSAAFTFSAKEIVQASFDWIGKNFNDSGTYTMPTIVAEDPVVFYTATVTMGGSPVSNIKSMDLNIDRSLSDDQYCLGSFVRQILAVSGMTTAGGKITFTEQEYTKFKTARTGGATGTIDVNNPLGTETNIVITCVDLSSPAETVLVITIPVSVYTDTDRSIDEQNEIEKTLSYEAVGSGLTFAVTESA